MKMRFGFRNLQVVIALVLLIFSTTTYADVQITLHNSFIEKYKNTATIDVSYVVDKAHKHPNRAANDGDLHIAGRAKEVKLPIVAEIMNAASESDAVDAVHNAEGTSHAIHMKGAWRIWMEHGGDSIQTQGHQLSPFTTTNPDHVFEIHPVTAVGNLSLLDSFHPIDGFTPKDAERAFHRYENTRFEIIPGHSTTKMITSMAGYNYVEFLMELNKAPYKVSGGHMVMASVNDLKGELLVRNRRMVFVKDTPPDVAVRNLNVGDCLHVLGIPRISLTLVSWRAHHAAERPDVLKWGLPYEIIVVGVYKDDACNAMD